MGARLTVTNAAAVDAVREHGSRRAAARALGVDESTVRRALARTDPPPAVEPVAAGRVLSVVVLDADPGDGRVRVPAARLVEVAGQLRAARAALHAGDARGADRLLGAATASAAMLASVATGRG